MPDNNIASSSSFASSTPSMPPPPNKKRKKSVTIAPSQPTQVALPPPLIPYPPPHLMPSYYPVYHQHPYFLSVGPQPPISPSLSPTLSSASSTAAPATVAATSTAPTTQRILPKSPASTPTTAASAAISPSTLAPTFNFYPYPMQISPQLHPTAAAAAAAAAANAAPLSPVPFGMRHNSVSSTTSNSTADQREQARKVSHSAIERRRRERINDKILQLKDLIPSCADRDNLHKMTILQSAIDYITYLKKVIADSPTLAEEDLEKLLPDQIQKSNSMLSKEVDQFTNQFSAHPTKAHSQSQETSTSDANGTKSIEAEEDVEEEEDEEDSWSMSTSKIDRSKTVNTSISTVTPLPSSGLKPMDVIKLNKSVNASPSSSCSPPSPTATPPAPPKIIVNSQEVVHEQEDTATCYNHTERNMNLENILC
ncbi:unnamed protein product [Mucor fragilis]